MARIARVVVPGIPHHITQRGNRRMQTFFNDDDYQDYLGLMAVWCREFQVEIWAYCLMPNHIHMIAVPERQDSLRRAIAEAHRRYTRMVNFRERWRGHLWQGRFASFPMDEKYLLATVRYLELNPVRAGLVEDPCAWRWSSAAAHVKGEDDTLVVVSPLRGMVGNWRDFLDRKDEQTEFELVRRHERTGRPLGEEGFIEGLERLLQRTLRPQKRGPKEKNPTTN
jgi:putative transposase